MHTILDFIWNAIKGVFIGYFIFFVLIPIGYDFGRELARQNDEVTISYGLHGLCVTHRNHTRCE